jgi:hypothetical protein
MSLGSAVRVLQDLEALQPSGSSCFRLMCFLEMESYQHGWCSRLVVAGVYRSSDEGESLVRVRLTSVHVDP